MLSQTSKLVLMFTGLLAAALIVAQLVMGQVILRGPSNPSLMEAHQVSGYLTVGVSLVYIFFSVWVMTSLPTSPAETTTPSTRP